MARQHAHTAHAHGTTAHTAHHHISAGMPHGLTTRATGQQQQQQQRTRLRMWFASLVPFVCVADMTKRGSERGKLMSHTQPHVQHNTAASTCPQSTFTNTNSAHAHTPTHNSSTARQSTLSHTAVFCSSSRATTPPSICIPFHISCMPRCYTPL